jgi:hypothetical protein
MIFPRTKLITKFSESFSSSSKQYTAIVWEPGTGKTIFFTLLRESVALGISTIETIFVPADSTLDQVQITNPNANLIIIDSDNPLDIYTIRSFIESNSPDSRVIFTSEAIVEDSLVENFSLGTLSFREYSEWMNQSIDVGAIMSWSADTLGLNHLRDSYIHLGAYPKNLDNESNIQVSFDEKLSIMNQELFKKEEWDFLEFIRTVAMNVGDIFKEERIAKNMNISRRKVRKYTEIILKHNLIRAIGPWVENHTTELSRHVKVYFSDLSYFYAALGVGYYIGSSKQGVIENFILIELDRKLATTHEIRFYRKKSGAEVSFILVERETNKLTPIEVTTRSTDIIPQALRTFYEAYGDRIDHAMIMNDSIAWQKDIHGTPVIILPHVAI